MPHLLCFLAARIAQPCDRPEPEPVRWKGRGRRFHARLCKIADRLAEDTSISSSKFVGQDRNYWFPLACEEGRWDCSSHLPFAMGRFVFGPFALGR